MRRSARAKRVTLTVFPEGVVVTVPKRFCVSRDLPPILESKKDWIAAALAKMRARAAQGVLQPQGALQPQGVLQPQGEPQDDGSFPSVVNLRALGETWKIDVAPLMRERLAVQPDGRGGTITMTAEYSEKEALAALRRWVKERAAACLPDMLRREAEILKDNKLSGVVVKEAQKRQWGSCSARGRVNLNSHLLFLPPRLVRYVMLHELCHLREMNHSPAFYALMASIEPEAPAMAAELKHAWGLVPRWARRSF